jgi:D-xylose transport system ATP-binding protein
MALLELRAITRDFPGVRALDQVSFDLRGGEIHALCGENGAGKSTLLKVVSGFYPAGSYGGEILLDGVPARFRSIHAAEARGIALISQELALVPELSVGDNLLLGREPVRAGLIDRAAAEADSARALSLVGLEVDPACPVRELGVGQQQLLEIAKALLKQARVLVLDEPTAALTERDVERLFGLLRDLRARGVAIAYVSHRLDEIFRIADRITVLRDGRSVGGGPAHEIERHRVIALMVGREVDELYPRPPLPPVGPPALAVSGLCVAHPANPARQAVADVSFEVAPGEVLGIAGLMGAGRTALLAALFGAARGAVGGTLALGGGPPLAPPRSPREAIARGIALVSEDRKRYGLVPGGTVVDNLSLVALGRFARRGLIDEAARERACDAQVRALRVRAPGLGTPAARLSGGNQQKLVLGKWLLARPRVLLLDEPTRGVDVGARAEIYDLVGSLARDGVAVVMASSDLPELLGLSHRVIVLSEGRCTAVFGPGEATPEAVMAAATRRAA